MILNTPPSLTNKSTFLKYIQVDLWNWLREVSLNITKINFADNFQSFLVENLLIPAGQEVAIENQFRSRNINSIPTGRIIVRQKGDANIIDGNTDWNLSTVYLRNPSANDATVTVLFFK